MASSPGSTGRKWPGLGSGRPSRSVRAGDHFLRPTVDSGVSGGIFSTRIETGSFSALIELLETQGNVQILSSPRVSTVNNQKAVIKVGQDEYFHHRRFDHGDNG